jgi:2'-5' RNA ligase
MNPETIRTFIAIELPEAVKGELMKLEASLKMKCPDVVKWVDPAGIHLTLKFLGDVAAGQVDEITLGMEEAVLGMTPLRLEVQGIGAFPNLNRVQVVWVGMRGELDRLAQLQRRIESNMEHLGFPKEERAFTPHLTLGRVRYYAGPEDRKKLGQVLSATVFPVSQPFTVEAVHIVKSQLTPKGAIYSILNSVILKG